MLRPKTFKILSDCIESGIRSGHATAYQQTEDPDRKTIESAIYNAIMLEVDDKFTCDDDDDRRPQEDDCL